MPTDYQVDKRDVNFVVHEQLKAEELCRLDAFQECNREMFEMVVDEAIKVATEVLAPLNPVGDRQGLKFEAGRVITPAGFKEGFRKFAEGGWIGMVHDPELGGQGLPHLVKFAASEIFTGANIALFLTSILTEGAAHLIEKYGTPEMRRLYCPRMYGGQWTGTMCLTEPAAGSDVGNLKTSARKNGDHYLITGSKIFISAGEHDMTENIIHPVLARIEGAPAGTKGISLFLVPKMLVNPDGSLAGPNDVSCGNIEHKMGIKSSPTCTMNFGDNGRCRGWLLGEENGGMAAMFQMMNEARLGVGIQGLGLAAAAFQSALAYARERTQGGSLRSGGDPRSPRVPIVQHPDVRRMLMFAKSLVEGMRSMMYSVARYIDLSEHSPDAKEKERCRHFVELLTPICKAYGSDMGFRVNETAVQIFGGYGYCQEYPVEQYLRDQKISSIYEGTNGIQAIDLLSRKIARNQGAYLREFLEMVGGLCHRLAGHQRLGKLAAQLGEAAGTVSRVVQQLGKILAEDPELVFLQATPFLEMFGHVVVGYYHLEAAEVADRRLEQLLAREGGDAVQAARKNSEVAFYHGRVCSARFFYNYFLSHVPALAQLMLSGERAALEAYLEG